MQMITRIFEVEGHEGQHVSMGLTVPSVQPAGEWACTVQILVGNETPEESVAYGEDPLQALLLGVQLASILLRNVERRMGWRLLWFGSTDWGLGV
jgi:hypothetical protein